MFEDDKDCNLPVKGRRNSMSESNLQSRNGKIELNDHAQNSQNKTWDHKKISVFAHGFGLNLTKSWRCSTEGGLVGNRSLFA